MRSEGSTNFNKTPCPCVSWPCEFYTYHRLSEPSACSTISTSRDRLGAPFSIDLSSAVFTGGCAHQTVWMARLALLIRTRPSRRAVAQILHAATPLTTMHADNASPTVCGSQPGDGDPSAVLSAVKTKAATNLAPAVALNLAFDDLLLNQA
jgi:hypothetical protein